MVEVSGRRRARVANPNTKHSDPIDAWSSCRTSKRSNPLNVPFRAATGVLPPWPQTPETYSWKATSTNVPVNVLWLHAKAMCSAHKGRGPAAGRPFERAPRFLIAANPSAAVSLPQLSTLEVVYASACDRDPFSVSRRSHDNFVRRPFVVLPVLSFRFRATTSPGSQWVWSL